MASMSRSSLRSEMLRRGRIGSNVSTTVLDAWLYEAVKKLQDDLLWLHKKRIYYTREFLTLGTDEGFGITYSTATGTVTAIGLSTSQTDASGADLSSYLSSVMDTLTGYSGHAITYSTSDRKFTVDISGTTLASTGLLVGPPYYDASFSYDISYKLFGYTARTSASTQSIEGEAVPYCYSEYPLPSDFLSVKEVRYDDKDYPLMPEIYKDRDTGTGTPSHFYISGNYLGLTPEPTDGGKIIELDYYYLPSDFASDSATHPFEEVYNYAIIYNAVALYKESVEDYNGMYNFLGKYENEKRKALQRKNARVGGAINLFDRGKSRKRYDPRRYNLG